MEKIIKEKCFSLDKLKEDYEELKNKYALPEFSELNRLFDIEDVEIETDFLLRKIRRIISERMAAYSRFIEIILNPSNAPMFFFKLIKKLDSKDKEVLAGLYEELGSIEVDTISLDLDYSEKNEADFIIRMYKVFNENIRIKFLEIVDKLSNGNDNNKKYNGSYFG